MLKTTLQGKPRSFPEGVQKFLFIKILINEMSIVTFYP